MEWVWNWGGESFGYFDGDDLWTHDGRHVGKRQGDEIYGSNGQYIGEVMSGNRLITNNSKSSWHSYSFSPYGRRAGYARYANYAGYAMYAGHSDFPHPDEL